MEWLIFGVIALFVGFLGYVAGYAATMKYGVNADRLSTVHDHSVKALEAARYAEAEAENLRSITKRMQSAQGNEWAKIKREIKAEVSAQLEEIPIHNTSPQSELAEQLALWQQLSSFGTTETVPNHPASQNGSSRRIRT